MDPVQQTKQTTSEQSPGATTPEQALAGVSSGELKYRDLPEKLQADKKIAEAQFNRDPLSIGQFPKSLHKDIDFMERLINRNGRVFMPLMPKEMRSNPRLIVAAVRSNPEAVLHVPAEALRGKSDLLKQIAETSINTEAHLKEVLGELPKEITEVYDKHRQALELLGIGNKQEGKETTFTRFDDSAAILRGRYAVSSEETREKLEQLLGKTFLEQGPDTRPSVLVLMGKLDTRGALDQQGPIGTVDPLDQLTEAHRVLYYEVGSEADITRQIAELKASAAGPLDYAVLGMHGGRAGMHLGPLAQKDTFSWQTDEQAVIDLYDNDVKTVLSGLLKPQGIAVLVSCSTGSGTAQHPEFIENIAEWLQSVWPESTVHAPTEPTIGINLVDEQTRLLSAPRYQSNLYADVKSLVLPPLPEGVRPRLRNEKEQAAQLSEPAQRLFDIVSSPDYRSMWNSWKIPRGKQGYVEATDPRLLQLKDALAAELKVAATSIQVGVRFGPGHTEYEVHTGGKLHAHLFDAGPALREVNFAGTGDEKQGE